jgi:hypothetical protein
MASLPFGMFRLGGEGNLIPFHYLYYPISIIQGSFGVLSGQKCGGIVNFEKRT